ncbi:MAG TPA: ATP-binding protein [Streptosporangiaceae bacterium]|nr:ATP-binding protein [Streptosporangiaceae bacterium]
MRRSADMARQPTEGPDGNGEAGPALTTLRAAAVKAVVFVRCVVIVYLASQVVLWHAFYAADPWRLVGPCVAAAWAGAIAVNLRRWPPWQSAALDGGVGVVLALAAGWCVPPALRGEAQSWLYIYLAGQVQVTAWFAPLSAVAPVALVRSAAYWAGAALTPVAASSVLSASAFGTPAKSAVFLLVGTAAALAGFEVLRRRAVKEDAALGLAYQEARAEYIVLHRNIEQREHERLIHDTVLNTLTALARVTDTDRAEVVGRCRTDLTLVERALSSAGESATGDEAAGDGLVREIRAVADEMRARGLEVHVDVGAAATGPEGGPGAPGRLAVQTCVPAVPVGVGAAIVHALREALANVAAHAGTGEAWVSVSQPSPGGVRVSVRDEGVGFDPSQVDPVRLGVRRSIVERLADCGGRALLCSAPGEGTMVTLAWDAVSPPWQPGCPGERHELGRAMSAARPDEAVWDAYEPELPRALGVAAAILQLIALIQLVVSLHGYRYPGLSVGVWLGLLAVAAWLVPRAMARGLTSTEAAVAVAVPVAAVALVGWDRLPTAAGAADWSVVGAGWLLALLALSRPFWVCACGALLVFAAHAVIVFGALRVSPMSLTLLMGAAYPLSAILGLIGGLRPTLRAYAGVAARRAKLANRATAERAAGQAVRQDRQARLDLLEAEVLPLLRGIAAEVLDPAGQAVRERCARDARTLRQVLVDRVRGTTGLLGELAPALRAAEDRGLPVEVQVVGSPEVPSPEVAGATLAAVDGVLRALPPHQVTLTVLADGEEVELFMTFAQPPQGTPQVAGLGRSVPARARWRARVDAGGDGSGCLEVRWRTAVA